MLTLKEVERRSKEKGFIFLDEFYNNTRFKHNFKCIKDNEIHKSTFQSIQSGRGLKCCGERKCKLNGIKRILSLKEVKRRSKEKGFIFLDKEFKGNRFKHNFKCLEDGEIHLSLFGAIHNGQGLKCCGKRKARLIGIKQRLSLKEVRERSLKRGFEFLDKEYKGNSFKYNFRCLEDNEIHQSRCNDILDGAGLKCCGRRKWDLLLKSRLKDVKKVSLECGFIFLDKEYKGSGFKHNFRCLEDKEIHKTSMDSIKSGSGLKCCGIRKRTGENSPNWNPNLTNEERFSSRRMAGDRGWKEQVKKRDNYQCQICSSEDKIHIHHMANYSDNRELAIDINNGITLCEKHHILFHKIYGSRNNTEKQFRKFKKKIKEQE